jgi:hypothetical protein
MGLDRCKALGKKYVIVPHHDASVMKVLTFMTDANKFKLGFHRFHGLTLKVPNQSSRES